jgi:hypothetical protein
LLILKQELNLGLGVATMFFFSNVPLLSNKVCFQNLNKLAKVALTYFTFLHMGHLAFTLLGG